MNRKNQLNSQENFRAAIESALERKKDELGLWPPTTEDHEEVTEQMVELFLQFKEFYFPKEHIIPALKFHFPAPDPVYDRVGPKGRDEILSVLKEKGDIKEYWTIERQIRCDRYGSIISIGEPLDPWDTIEGKIQVYRSTMDDEAYRDNEAFEAQFEELNLS